MRVPRAFVGAAYLFLNACSTGSRATPRAPEPDVARPYVILISFDAFRHDYIERFQPPAIKELAARGVRATALIPVFPSKTFPNHYSIVTGLYPANHGIVGNAFYDPSKRAWYRNNDTVSVRDSSWYRGEPIWITAERQGVRTGAFFWPGSEAASGGLRPSLYEAYDGTISNEQRLGGIIAWLRKPPAERPHFVLSYFSDIDDTTHRHGPDAEQTRAVVAAMDRIVRQLLDSINALPIRDSVNLVLVSDHGMAQLPAGRTIPVYDLLVRGGVDTSGILLSDNGATMSLWIGADSARLLRARDVLRASPARVYLRSELPARWHAGANTRTGDLMLVADEGMGLVRRSTDRVTARGVHGYDPAGPNMHAFFVAAGPNVRPLGVISAFENVHVFPFLAGLLRLTRLPPIDGDASVLRGLLR